MPEAIYQIVITRVEEPVDAPRGEVFKISLFDRKECVDTFHHGSEESALEEIKNWLEDLRSA